MVKLNLLSVVKTHGFFGLVFVIKTSGLSLSLPLEDMAVSEFGVVSFTANGRPALELDLAFVEFTLADSPEGWIGRFELCLEIKHKVSGTTLGWLVWGVV